MSRILVVLVAVVSFASGLPAQTVGEPDLSFGLTGRVSYDFGLGRDFQDTVMDVAALDGGRVVAVGWSEDATAFQGLLFRLHENGDLDLSYGFTWGSGSAGAESFTDVARLPGSDDVLVAGWDMDVFSGYAVLLRVDGNSNIVAQGQVNIDLLTGTMVRIGQQSDGRILLAWSDGGWQANLDFVVCRFLDPANLDLSFGSQGCRRIAFDLGAELAGYDELTALAVLPDDRILLVGATHGADRLTLVARLLPGGDPDPGFGTAGKLWLNLSPDEGEWINDAVVLSDGTALLAGWDSGDSGFRSTLVSVAPDGGSTTVTHPGDHGVDAWLGGVAAQGDGKIVVAGAELDGRIYFVRLLPDGSPDPTFGSGGESLFPIDPIDPTIGARVLALDLNAGRPVAAGFAARSDVDFDSALVRVTSDYVFADGFEGSTTRAWSAAAP